MFPVASQFKCKTAIILLQPLLVFVRLTKRFCSTHNKIIMQRAILRVPSISMRTTTSPNLLFTQIRAISAQSYTDRQAKTGRPVSPHVTIYRFPIAAVTSIMNRVTGVALSVGITGIGALAIVGVDSSSIMTLIGSTAIVGPVAKFLVGFPLIYHYFGAVRHAVWDKMPETTLTSSMVTNASHLLLGVSIVSSVAATFVTV